MDQQERVGGESAGAGGMGPLKRRGLIAGLAALAAAGLARLAGPERAEAADGANVQVGAKVQGNNPSSNPTWIEANVTGNPGLRVTNGSVPFSGSLAPSSDGIQGYAQGNNEAGLSGRNDDPLGQGVRGHSTNGTGVLGFSTLGTGVHGDSSFSGIGVEGTSLSNVGVRGRNFGSNAASPGVQGISMAGFGVHGSSANNVGVLGLATGAANASPGVYGAATQGYGVFGFSNSSNGIAGQSGGSAAGCVGFAGAPGGYGIYGGTAAPGGYAGGFAGPVLVNGAFTVVNGPKNAAVPHPDGSHRLLYCQESPEPWFEDFGEAKLVNGKAEVKIEQDYAAVVDTAKYQVFVTPYEANVKGLAVAARRRDAFEVQELGGGTSGAAFGYRIVAKRKDIPGPRLEKVKLPEPIKELVKPELPKPSEPPKAPEPPRPVR